MISRSSERKSETAKTTEVQISRVEVSTVKASKKKTYNATAFQISHTALLYPKFLLQVQNTDKFTHVAPK